MKLILTGHYAGRTIDLNGYKFVNGELTLKGEMTKMEGVINYFRTYNAFLAGSDELAQAQARDANKGDTDGTDTVLDGQSGTDTGGVSTDITGTGTGSGPESGGASPDGAGSGSEGNGVQGGREVDEGQAAVTSDPTVLKIIDGLKSLDPTNDDHWTDAGLPRVDVIAQASGVVNVTRKDIAAAIPNFNREVAMNEV